jgi:hypothetical protein
VVTKGGVWAPTVDGDSNALRESKAILALESRDLSQRVDLEKLSRSLARLVLGVDQVKTVGLCNRLDGSAAGVVLEKGASLAMLSSTSRPGTDSNECGCWTEAYRGGEESSESHCEDFTCPCKGY